jgi:hypothetical protein
MHLRHRGHHLGQQDCGEGSDTAASVDSADKTGTATATQTTTDEATDKTTTQAPAKKAEPKEAGIGDAVKSGDLTITVTQFKCGVTVSDGYQNITAQGQFCKMPVTIKNDGTDQKTVDDSQLKVKDAKGNEYGTSSDTMTVDGNIFLKQINPGNKISGIAYFDVPKGVTPTTAVFKGGLLSGSAEISLS